MSWKCNTASKKGLKKWKLDVTKPVIAKGVYRTILRELENTTARPHSIMSESL